ncbi:hypothetical protein [Polaromonas sp.]|jgi:hypothetical protein|uniref:hypothetical protein n=1 Tax=Polaromonas sp. TaxID=1869339 RepID=UPI0017F6427F|nr:hypothetical protein [Polaromonas sp.]NMM07507.1 hypothetical protein [Polaromonas sp.]
MAIDVNMDEVLIAPLSSMVREISAGVAAAQRELDAAALATQTQLATEHPELQALGYQVTWYQIPEATVEMRMALHFEKKDAASPARMYVAPFNTKYRNTFSFSADGSSTLKLKIVPVPPQGRSA